MASRPSYGLSYPPSSLLSPSSDWPGTSSSSSSSPLIARCATPPTSSSSTSPQPTSSSSSSAFRSPPSVTPPVWPFGDGWCKIYQCVVHVPAYASVYTLVMMSFDRYLAVVHPVRSMTWRTGRNASIVATASWVLILGVNVPVIVEHRTVVYHFDGQERSACLNALIYNDDDPATTYYHGRVYYAC